MSNKIINKFQITCRKLRVIWNVYKVGRLFKSYESRMSKAKFYVTMYALYKAGDGVRKQQIDENNRNRKKLNQDLIALIDKHFKKEIQENDEILKKISALKILKKK